MNIYRLIYIIGINRAKRPLLSKYGIGFYEDFVTRSSKTLTDVISKTPCIGNTIFSFNYAFTPAYISWYKAAQELDKDEKEIQSLLWLLNQNIIKVIPKFFIRMFAKKYLADFRKNAALHEKLIEEGKVHPYDYLLKFRDIDKSTFEIDITQCGMMILAKDFNALGIFPTVCRVDYMLFNYMGTGFERTKTLGDGNDCCNCRYTIGGTCEWAPEKGFQYRK